MKKCTLMLVFLIIAFAGLIAGSVKGANQITMTIVYDNYVFEEGTIADWGFACFIEGTEKTILFDTGLQGNVLLHNIDNLNLDLDSLELIVISHNHLDHTGGLNLILAKNSDVAVYFGTSFPYSFSVDIQNHGAVPVRVDESIEICDHVFSTGEMEGPINEQSLILDTDQGLVIITGCSHPGIVNILERAKEILDKDIFLVFGGFHLLNHSEAEINQIIEEFKALGVKKCGPSHCTGDRAIALFKQAYGEDFIQMGVGKVLQVCISPVSVEENNDEQSSIPNRFKLEANYPNPFNTKTIVRYDIPMQSYVKLEIYNILGEKVATLINSHQVAGTHSISWDGRDISGRLMPGGIYLCRFQTVNYLQTIRMVMLK